MSKDSSVQSDESAKMSTLVKEDVRLSIVSMCEFIQRACKEGATPEQVEAIPKVAQAVKDLIFW